MANCSDLTLSGCQMLTQKILQYPPQQSRVKVISSHPQVVQGDGAEGLWSVHNSSLSLPPLHTLPLLPVMAQLCQAWENLTGVAEQSELFRGIISLCDGVCIQKDAET